MGNLCSTPRADLMNSHIFLSTREFRIALPISNHQSTEKTKTMRGSMAAISQLVLYSILLSTIRISTPVDTISPGQSIKDGETLVSNGEAFELGFFSPGRPSNRYLAVWYRKFSRGTVVWVANRDSPISDFSGCLNLTKGGVLVLVNGTGQVVWQSIIETTKAAKNPMLKLLDSGNLIVIDENETDPENYLWQSFHFPGDTMLPGFKLGRNLVTGQEWSLTSWKSFEDPAKGDYTYSIDPRGYPQGIMRRGNGILYRQGSWNGLRFTGSHAMKSNPFHKYVFEINQREVYYSIELLNNSLAITRTTVNASGLTARLTWDDKMHSWSHYSFLGVDHCDDYNLCGVNARCNYEISQMCQCLEGFEPRDPIQWSNHEWSGGCVRNSSLSCAKGEGFVMHEQMKLPDTSDSWFNMSLNLEECKKLCLKNCSCVAYANTDVRNGGSGCVLWFSDLKDMRLFELGVNGQELYVRMAASYIESIKRKEESKKRIGVIVCSIIFGVGVLLLGWVAYTKRRKLKTLEKIKMVLERDYKNQSQTKEIVDMELPIFDLATIAKATNQFSIANKLGEGGFGPVYKGDLLNGQEIAVKRLSVKSGQGLEEFKNEVLLIAKLQHRNLVKLLGCCIQGHERMLIYEYMPNKSLDCFIFDSSRRKQLNWKKRMNIILGIARGLLYLHQDSRLRIIHRDLKTSNVLLDDSMNPKISDFGMARIFGVDQIEAATNRVVGTYGYMAPEYAVDGFFSVKSDVFSFGVIVLEIVSGRRSKGFFTPQHHLNLAGYAWKLWVENRPLELIDDSLEMSWELSEIIRCIHISLLCVQQQPEDRPNMSTVVLMLGGGSSLPQPKQRGFFSGNNFGPESESSSTIFIPTSNDEIDTSVLYPR